MLGNRRGLLAPRMGESIAVAASFPHQTHVRIPRKQLIVWGQEEEGMCGEGGDRSLRHKLARCDHQKGARKGNKEGQEAAMGLLCCGEWLEGEENKNIYGELDGERSQLQNRSDRRK